MTGRVPLPGGIRDYLADGSLAGLWAQARARLERNDLTVGGTLTLSVDPVAADRLSGLLGRVVPAGRARLRLAELDVALRSSAAGQGLISVLEALDGRPLTNRAAARRDGAARWAAVWQGLDAGLAAAGLSDASWVPAWIAGLSRSGILTRAGAGAAAQALTHATAALGLLARSSAPRLLSVPAAPAVLPVPAEPGGWELAALAGRATGGAHGLDDSRLAATVLLRAAALALGVDPPESAAGRRALWRDLGVATDAVSGTVLAWRLRPPGAGRWPAMMRERAELGLVTHLTMHELDHSGPAAFAGVGEPVYVCENPQVLQAAAHAGVERTLLCLSGNPATVGMLLLRALIDAGNPVLYHGDFDWPGVAIAGRVITAGARPWRMSSTDYSDAVSALEADRRVLLTGRPAPTPWDPRLGREMSSLGLAVHEESLLEPLLADLRGLPRDVTPGDRRDDQDQHRRDRDLEQQGEQPRRVDGPRDGQAAAGAEKPDEDRQQAPDGLPARHDEPAQPPDDEAGEQGTDDAGRRVHPRSIP